MKLFFYILFTAFLSFADEKSVNFIDTPLPQSAHIVKQKRIYKGLYIFDKDLPVLDDRQLLDIFRTTSKIFKEQLGEEIIFSITKRVEITDIFNEDILKEKVDDYCKDYIINFSSHCDLNLFSQKFEFYPSKENANIIAENLKALFKNPKVRENFSVESLKYYFPTQSENIEDILDIATSTYIDLYQKMKKMKNKNGEEIFSKDKSYYSLSRWRAYFNRYKENDIDFVITNVPLLELNKTPTLHLMKRGGLTGGTIIPTVSPFSKNHSKLENKSIILLSHFIYYFEDDFFKLRDLTTEKDKQKALACTFLMEYIHQRFSLTDNYKENNILKPANGFKFKEWIERIEKNPFIKKQ